MNKNIDADRLRTEIEKRLKNIRNYMTGSGIKYKGPRFYEAKGKESAYDAVLSLLYSFQQEQPEVDDIEFRCGYFSGPIFPAWIDAPSTLQPAHKYHGLEVAACHLKGGGYRVVPRNEPVSFELPEGTHLVGGWKEKAPED